ncbi:general secretion pathway protein D [Rhodopirellula baltica SH28]|uniref:General secretion pathway protein D n=1 Tax=Rhodopirellula baltica SH28 TaxID=993517 RepID=K5CAJ0_RHOBT|nr:secretin N-terminal domain-containing protein [Rhodopirellula baltica]EKK00260.1 general secretion pathway protein D [Rhodopirellula baltica SH28]
MAKEGSASQAERVMTTPSDSLVSPMTSRRSKARRALAAMIQSATFGVGLSLALFVTTWSGSSVVAAESNTVSSNSQSITVESKPGEVETKAAAGASLAVGPESQVQLNGPPLSIDEVLSQRGSITFRKTSLQEVVFLLSDLWNINIVAGEKITGNVSGVFKEAPLRDVLSAILTSSGYGYIAAGNSLVVLPLDEVGTGSPDFESRTLQFRAADEAEMSSTIAAAQLLLSDRGRIQPIGRGAILVVDSKDNIDRVQQMLIAMLPEATVQSTSNPSDGTSPGFQRPASPNVYDAMATEIIYLTPQFTEASEMRESLEGALGEGTIVSVYEAENRILIKGNRAQLELASQAFKQLDVPRAQVRITALIYDVSLEELEELGVNWGRGFRLDTTDESALADLAGNVEKAVTFGTLGSGGASSFGIRTLTDTFDTSVLLRALDSSDEAKLLADPSITAIDRREASIKIVQQIPIVAASPAEGSNVVFAQVEFKDAGIILKVTPRISNDNTIELQVQPEYSVKVGEIENNPVIDSRTAETTVRVANGHMFTLGGLRQKRIIEGTSGVPYLRDLKYVGKLFRSHSTEVRESELIVFLKPEIISPYDHGNERSRQAMCVANRQLDEIPYASVCPQTPYCYDKNCPNHHPRPRVNGGTDELQMLGGEGIAPMELSFPGLVNPAPVVPGQISPLYESERVISDSIMLDSEPMMLETPTPIPGGSSSVLPAPMLNHRSRAMEGRLSSPSQSGAIVNASSLRSQGTPQVQPRLRSESVSAIPASSRMMPAKVETFRSLINEPLRADLLSNDVSSHRDAEEFAGYPPVYVRKMEQP